MFEHTLGGGNIFKAVAFVLLLAVVIGASALAKRSNKTNRLRQWLVEGRTFQSALVWLSIALMFCLFGGLTIAYELRQ
jgi:hypothetical protein